VFVSVFLCSFSRSFLFEDTYDRKREREKREERRRIESVAKYRYQNQRVLTRVHTFCFLSSVSKYIKQASYQKIVPKDLEDADGAMEILANAEDEDGENFVDKRGGCDDLREEGDLCTENYDEIRIGRKEAGFLIGERGFTKRKVQRVSKTLIEITDCEDDQEVSVVIIKGSDEAREKAKRYVMWVLRQQEGKIFCDLEDDVVRANVSVVDVPSEAMAFVVGARGKTLRGVEDEYGTLMFFGHVDRTQPDDEKLIICGDRECRRGAELKVMSSVETKIQGYFVDYEKNELRKPLYQQGDGLKDGFAYDQFPFTEEEFSYALGKGGKVRRKLAKASGCVMEYLGRVAIMAGNKEQRARCWDYTNWLMKQRQNNGTCSVDPSQRTDCEIVDVPGTIDLPRLQGNCRKVEESTDTFIFTTDFEKPVVEGEDKTLLICSHDAQARRRARRMVEDLIDGRRDVFENQRGGTSSQHQQQQGRAGRGGGGRPMMNNPYQRNNGQHHQQQQQQRTTTTNNNYRVEMCRNFQMGRCTRGSICKYSHDMSISQNQRRGGAGGFNNANRGNRGYDNNNDQNQNRNVHSRVTATHDQRHHQGSIGNASNPAQARRRPY